MQHDTFDDFKLIIKENIIIRHNDFLECEPLKINNYHITTEKYISLIAYLNDSMSIQHILNNPLFLDVFSKGIYRAELLYEYMNNILYFSKTEINFESDEHKHKSIASIIVISQIFGDANHRTSLFYLNKKLKLTQFEIRDIMNKIENLFFKNKTK